jgi:hypothetical protein
MDEQGSKTLTFAEYIRECGGAGAIYDQECQELIKSWKGKDWIHVDDYIAPIVHQILVDAAEVHPRLYAKLMELIVEAYDELIIGLGPEPDKPILRRIK